MPRISQKGKGRRQAAPRRRYTVRGSGAYTLQNGPWAKRGAAVGSFIGGKYGGPIGSFVGGAIGRRLFHYPAKLFGSGAYTKRRRPYIRGHGEYEVERMAPEVPTFAKKGDYVEISHREYIGDIISSAVSNGTVVNRFAITPGESATFPWLSSIVQPSFQQYKFEGCLFQFQSRSSDALNSTNTALGSIVAGIDYDATAADYTTRAEIENLQWSSSCKPSCDMDIPVECASKYTALGGGLLYVLNSAGIPANSDLKTFLLGKLFILTTGCQGTNVNLGSLYVTYKIRLYKPMIQKPLSNANIVKVYRSGIGNTLPGGTGTISSTFACDSIGATFDSLGVTFDVSRLQPGARYWVLLQYVGTNSANIYFNAPGIALTGLGGTLAFIDITGGIDGGTAVMFPTTNTGTTDVQCGALLELIVLDNVKQTGASINFGTTGHGFPGAAKLLFFMIQRNGSSTDTVGSFRGW